jgi:hypothetical protein
MAAKKVLEGCTTTDKLTVVLETAGVHPQNFWIDVRRWAPCLGTSRKTSGSRQSVAGSQVEAEGSG